MKSSTHRSIQDSEALADNSAGDEPKGTEAFYLNYLK